MHGPPSVRSRAQAYPSRPVRFIVPLAPGGGLDFIARLVGEYISRGLGQQVFVENRTGAGGTIGIDLAIKSPPDGYSLLLTNDNVAAAPHVMKLSVDYLKDLMPVSLLGRQPQVWAVHPSFDVKSIAELVAEVKKAGTMGCATSGVGSNQHVLMEWFAKVADIKLEHVPYRGAGQAINDLLAGHVKVACLGPTATLPHAQAQKIRLLAQSGEARSPSMPEVPTLQEAGYKGVALESWYAAFAPLGTPTRSSRGSTPRWTRPAPTSRPGIRWPRPRPMRSAARPRSSPPRRVPNSEKYARLVRELNIKMG